MTVGLVLIRADPGQLGLARLALAQFAFGAEAGIRTFGSWRAAEERGRPHWVKAQGALHSTVWGTERGGRGSAVGRGSGVPLDSGRTRSGYWRAEDWE